MRVSPSKNNDLVYKNGIFLLSFILMALSSVVIGEEVQSDSFGEAKEGTSTEVGCRGYYEIAKLEIFGWSPKANYFAFGYHWFDEAGGHIRSYILNSKENTFYKKVEKNIDEKEYDLTKGRFYAINAIQPGLKKLRISNKGNRIYQYERPRIVHDYYIPPGSKFCPPDVARLQIKGHPYTLRLKKQYKDARFNGKIAKFELLLINEETQHFQVLQWDKTFFRPRSFEYGNYSVYLSPQEDYIAVIIAQFEYGWEGLHWITFLCVTGRNDL